jgi:hypothetical protein
MRQRYEAEAIYKNEHRKAKVIQVTKSCCTLPLICIRKTYRKQRLTLEGIGFPFVEDEVRLIESAMEKFSE